MELREKSSNNVHPSNIYLLYVDGFSPSIYRCREAKPKKRVGDIHPRRGLKVKLKRDTKYEKRSHPRSTKKRRTEKELES
jgi:hypothetical protein